MQVAMDVMAGFAVIAVPVALTAFLVLLLKIIRLGRQASALQDLVNKSLEGLIFFEPNGHFLYANPGACRYFPFLKQKNNPIRDLGRFLDYIFDHAVECDASLRGALNKSAARFPGTGFREIVRWGDDQFCLVEAQKSDGGRTAIVLRDVSGMKRHEENFIRLSHYNYELSVAVEAATNGIVVTNPVDGEHKIVFANSAFCASVRRDTTKIIGAPLIGLLEPFIESDSARAIHEGLKSGVASDLEIRFHHRRNTRWFNLKLTPVNDDSGHSQLCVGVFTETTALKLREAEFFHAQKLEALGQLAAGVAHDFNNVLSIIDGYSRIAANHLDEAATTADYLQKIRKASERGAHLTRQMLTFSRHKIVEESVIDLAQVVRDHETLLRPLVDASVNLLVLAHSRDIFIEATPDAIMQILMNLTVNARDAMDQGGTLTVEVRRCGCADVPGPLARAAGKDREYACLSVADTGHGMGADVRARIFDPFFTTKEQGRGTGLGLSVVYGLVKQMGGLIDVRSQPGEGTTMAVYLPLSERRPQKQITGTPRDISTLSLKGYTALVAEDEPDLLALVSGMLERLGMTVLKASNGDEALLRQDDHEGTIDLLLTDVVMPGLGGLKVAEMICELRPGIHVIFMSGYPAGRAIAGVEIPEDKPFVAKPIQYEELALLIYQTLSGKGVAAGEQDKKKATPRWETSGTILKTGGHVS
jgi:signal transduction histidine kinase/FixJ family two-component response regulator